MTLENLRTRTSDCLSDLQLDALHVDELSGEALRTARAHLAQCARCTERSAAMTADDKSFVMQHPRAPLPVVVPLKRDRHARWWLSGALAAAAALVMFNFRAIPSEQIRTKGAGSVGFFVRHESTVRRGQPGERVVPGDALRFVVSSTEPRYVAVLSRDGAGRASVYYPAGAQAARVQAGVEQALDASVVLDDVLGTEQIYALVCAEPVQLAPLRDALHKAVEPAWPVSCKVERFTLLKGIRP